MDFDTGNYDIIHIRDLLVRGIVGIRSDERVKKQDILINISLWADIRKAGETDQLEDSFDYADLKKRVVEFVEGASFFLIERLAAAIAEICLEEPKVCQVKIGVDKPGALRFARSVGIEIIRRKESQEVR